MYKSATEHAKEIRKILKKEHGWTGRDVSVRSEYFSMGSAIRVSVKSAAVNIHVVEAVARGAERIDRCEYSGEILSGCNRYVSVSYDWEIADEIAAVHLSEVEAAEAALEAHVSDNVLLPIGDTGFLLGTNHGYAGFNLYHSEDGRVNSGSAPNAHGIAMALHGEVMKAEIENATTTTTV